MQVLDTDHMTLVQWGAGRDAQRLRERLESQGILGGVTTSIVTYEEQCRGWLAYVAKATRIAEVVDAYAKLGKHLDDYRRVQVLAFDDRCGAEYQRLRQMKLRVGPMDLKIAATVVVHNATLLSRNLRDFRRVPGLRVEDWTV
jgi:tRNA(fMet)-specific endonuclease VapC